MRYRSFDEWWRGVYQQLPWTGTPEEKKKAEIAYNAGANDGYRVVGYMESDGSEGSFGIRIAVRLPEPMFIVFDYDKMVGESRDPKNHDYTKTGLAPEHYVTPPLEDFLKKIQGAYARIDPAVEKQRKEIRQEMLDIFTKAGLTKVYVKEVPNEYFNDHWGYKYPWFMITTVLGPIKIGWRKRVINLDWSESEIKTDGEKLFKEEDVTKGKAMIHAWSPEKATKYIQMLVASHKG